MHLIFVYTFRDFFYILVAVNHIVNYIKLLIKFTFFNNLGTKKERNYMLI